MDLRFRHLGVAVPDLVKALHVYRELFGYEMTAGPFVDPIQKVSVYFLGGGRGGPGPMEIELVAPATEDSPIRGILKGGGGAYHLCYDTADLASTMQELVERGCLSFIRQFPRPPSGAAGLLGFSLPPISLSKCSNAKRRPRGSDMKFLEALEILRRPIPADARPLTALLAWGFTPVYFPGVAEVARV